MNQKQFLENIFEIARGDNAINKEYPFEEIYDEIVRMSELSYVLEEKFDEPELKATDPRVQELSDI